MNETPPPPASAHSAATPLFVVSARSTLGVPVIPPPAIIETANRMRRALGRRHRKLAPPPVQILEAALSLLDHRILVVLCNAGIPDLLDKPTSLETLAVATRSDADRLERLVRYSAARGWLRLDRRGLVRPNANTRFLRRDHPGGWRAWVDFVGADHVVNAISALDLAGLSDGHARANGSPFFTWLDLHPADRATFDQAMAAGARMHALMLDKTLSWRHTQRVCDVGGGTGELLRTLLDRHPKWQGTVFDLPGTIERAVQHTCLTAVAGDAFTSVPTGHDTYLLVNVLHDWSDEDATKILRNVRTACARDARVIVVDFLRHTQPRDDLALRTDALMAALTGGGRERTKPNFATLAANTGFRLAKTHRLASSDHALELAPALRS